MWPNLWSRLLLNTSLQKKKTHQTLIWHGFYQYVRGSNSRLPPCQDKKPIFYVSGTSSRNVVVSRAYRVFYIFLCKSCNIGKWNFLTRILIRFLLWIKNSLRIIFLVYYRNMKINRLNILCICESLFVREFNLFLKAKGKCEVYKMCSIRIVMFYYQYKEQWIKNKWKL